MAKAQVNRHSTSLAIPLIFSVFLLFFAQMKLNQLAGSFDSFWAPIPDPSRRQIAPRMIETVSVGNISTAVDWFLIKALVATDETKPTGPGHSSLYYALDLITELDPAFFEICYLANVLTVVTGDLSGARLILEKQNRFRHEKLPSYPESFKTKYWKNNWQIPLFLGYLYLFHLDDMPHAADAFRDAERAEGAPAYLSHLTQRLQKVDGEYEVGLKLLAFLISGAKTEKQRNILKARKANLTVNHFLSKINRAYQQTGKYPAADPWGGRLYVNATDRVTTSTAHAPVFGLN